MPSEFNPYREWMGVDLPGQSPNYYQLLGISVFESNPETIWAAAYQRRAVLRAEQYGDHAEIAKRLLDEVDAAEACLLNPGRKTDYDHALRAGETPPLIPGRQTDKSDSPPRSSGSRRSEQRLKPSDKAETQSPATAKESPAKETPPARDPVPDPPAPDPIAEAGRSVGSKAAWGYDDGIPFRAEVPNPGGNQPPMAAPMGGVPTGTVPMGTVPMGTVPIRPTDFLPAPASPASFVPPATPPMAGAPMASPPMAGAPLGTVPTAPGAYLPPGWTPGPTSPPAAAIPPTAAVPGYGATYPQYTAPPAAQPGWAGAPGASTASYPTAPYPTSPTAVPTAAMVPGELPGQMAPGYSGPTGYSPAPMATVPMAAPYGSSTSPAMAAPLATAPLAAPMAATPLAAAVPQAMPAQAIPADDFGPLPGVAQPAGPVVSGSPRRFVRRPSPALYALGGFLVAVAIGVAAIVAMNRRPPRDDHNIAQNPPDKTHESKTPETSRPSTKTPLVVPEKTTHPPSKTETDPPAKTEATPQKTPAKTEPASKQPAKTEPTKEPTTKQPPVTTENPKAKPKGDPQRDALVAAALMSARFYLAERNLPKADEMIALAKKNDLGGARQEETERVRLLAHYVDEFWKAVKAHCKGLDGGAALTIQKITIGFVEGTDEYVTFRREGRNERHYFFPSPAGPLMKTGLAVGLAELYLAKNDAVSNLILGSFKTINPTSDRAEARGHFDMARGLGGEDIKETVRLLRQELDVSIPKEAPKLPAVSSTPPEPAGNGNGGGKPKPPTGDALVQAQETMRAKYKQQLAGAVFESDKASLARKLRGAADSEGLDDVTRYVLLVEARDLAAGGRDPKLALEVVAAIDERFTIDLLVMKIDVLAAAQKSAGEDAEVNKQVAQTALALADEAALAEKFPAALRLANIALLAARKSKDPELVKQAVSREKEIRALKPSGS